MKARACEGLSGHAGGNRTSLNGTGTFEGLAVGGPSILETTVSDRGTLEDLSQSAISRPTQRRKRRDVRVVEGARLEIDSRRAS